MKMARATILALVIALAIVSKEVIAESVDLGDGVVVDVNQEFPDEPEDTPSGAAGTPPSTTGTANTPPPAAGAGEDDGDVTVTQNKFQMACLDGACMVGTGALALLIIGMIVAGALIGAAAGAFVVHRRNLASIRPMSA